MAYRVPRHPRVEHRTRRQNRLAGLTALVLLWSLVLMMALVAERGIARQHLPWKPLSIVDPVGMATRIKAARAGQGPGHLPGHPAQGGPVLPGGAGEDRRRVLHGARRAED